MTADEARAITVEINDTAGKLYELVYEAHERKAWSAVGYTTWNDYVTAEFKNVSRKYSYELIDKGAVMLALEAALGVSVATDIQLTNLDVRAIKAKDDDGKTIVRPTLLSKIEERIVNVTPGDVPGVQKVVERAVREERTLLKIENAPELSSLPQRCKDVAKVLVTQGTGSVNDTLEHPLMIEALMPTLPKESALARAKTVRPLKVVPDASKTSDDPWEPLVTASHALAELDCTDIQALAQGAVQKLPDVKEFAERVLEFLAKIENSIKSVPAFQEAA